MGDNLNNECVMQLMVTQHERFSESKNRMRHEKELYIGTC